jgi:4'-phosphopantetheinyl transferase
MIPALPDGTVQVWWAARQSAGEHLAAVLDEGEQVRWRRFLQQADRDRYLVTHALARLVLGGLTGARPAALTFEATCVQCGGPHGKPRLPGSGLEFSLSHSGGCAVIAVTRGVPVGVDVEATIAKANVDTLARAVLSEDERLGPDRAGDLTVYWTRKEAVLKTTGDGLTVSPRDLTVSSPSEPPALLAWKGRPEVVDLYDLHPGQDHQGSLGALAAGLRVAELDATKLLAG